jgi:hypothetical protein
MKNSIKIMLGMMLYVTAAGACDNVKKEESLSSASFGEDIWLITKSVAAGFGSAFLVDCLRSRGPNMKSRLTDNGICRDKMAGALTLGTVTVGMNAFDKFQGDTSHKDTMQQMYQVLGAMGGLALKGYLVNQWTD